MSVVKGSKFRPLKVVEYSPLKQFFGRLFLVVFIVASVSGSFYFGYFKGMSGQKQALANADVLNEQVTQKQQKIEELEQQVANLSMGAVVDRQASEDVRQEVIALKEELAKLQEDNSFYRNLMAPTSNKRGLSFGAVEIVDTDTPRQYRYKIVVQQLATNHTLLNGNLAFTVVGKEAGVEKSFKLQELSNDVSKEAIRLRFKYFQTIEGALTLPEGFDPEAIELVARSIGSKAVTIEKRFGWLVEES